MTPSWKFVNIVKTLGCLGKRPLSVSSHSRRSDLTILDVNDKTGVATLTMNRAPINALNAELLAAIRADLEQTKKNNSRGLIFTSSMKSVFSAGLDITELYKPDKERLRSIASGIQDVSLLLSTQPSPVVAFVNGHAPAGGCVLAISCEYRIMSTNSTIGLNEPLLGLIIPIWVQDILLNVLSRRAAELALTQGKLYSTEEASKIGLVDEVVNDKDEGLLRCGQYFSRFNKVNATARSMTKNQFRINEHITNKTKDFDRFLEYIMQPDVQEIVAGYLKSLKNKSKN